MEFRYKKKAKADAKASQIKRVYGYVPTVFKERNPKTNNIKYIVVKPFKLTKIKRR